MLRWSDPTSLRGLLCELVSCESGTGSDGEAQFPFRLAERLRELPYFADAPELVTPMADAERATFATALHRAEGVTDTIVLLSHYDTVGIAEYGAVEHLACRPEELTTALREQLEHLPADAAADLGSGEYLFGRGTADMKAGLALHIALLERAAAERWPINLLLLTVSDEEVSSIGMRDAVLHLDAMQRQHGLNYVLALNSEPSFPAEPGDDDQSIYSGTIGKLLPSALCFGRETHAGTPLAGISSTYIANWMTREMEWCPDFHEVVHGEPTPLPVNLWQRDLRAGYSTQTTSRTSVLYNVFVMEHTAAHVLDCFEAVAKRAAAACTAAYHEICAREDVTPIGDVRVIRYDELVEHATEHLGSDEVERILASVQPGADDDLASQSMQIADALLVDCPELAPAIVVMFTPPYYPAVTSSDDALTQACVTRVTEQARERFGLELRHRHWFNAISDLSYVNLRGSADGWKAYEANMPGFGAVYDLPFAAMERLRMPILNVGPRGKDLHMRTERLHTRSAFEELPQLLADLVQFVARTSRP
jgi:arginine utilization protein RocB